MFACFNFVYNDWGYPSGPHGNPQRKTSPATKHLPAMDDGTVSLSDRQLFPYVWNTKVEFQSHTLK